ncbi:hypothetical protein BHAOGJBA_4447 [Methylobacterium hispanicum]|uniref:DksA C4-type domain-containing protein n=1 Tax=Methylobacterium hispanicum TaxID=270350 RepID=A0AAV4ZSQ9_9HYPH|nr:hypothetical protein [Methylobacterium hispanicum]GJD90903.1 hypothetical protein BHAOGJBA_4447 [Methylobacterium hispanicum]
MPEDWKDELRQRYAWAARTPLAVGEGWRALLADTFERLDAAIRSVPADANGMAFQCHDVKEKYGTLRIEMVPYVEEVEAICLDAENRSETVCDVCGSTGRVREGAWVMVRCDAHAKGLGA